VNKKFAKKKTNGMKTKNVLAGLVTVGASVLFSVTSNAAVISIVDVPTLVGGQLQKPGYGSDQGAYRAYDTSTNLAYNGSVPVVSSTISGYPAIHNAAFLNDGYYGNGSSWISNSSNSWIIVDLGSSHLINSVSFGRDRLGYFDDRDPGQFTISLSMDQYSGYSVVADSSILSFSGNISGNDTILTTFNPVDARYVKLTFANDGVAIDELGVFAAPEPSTALLLGTGIIGIGVLRRKKIA
jgi:hypothetical protein